MTKSFRKNPRVWWKNRRPNRRLRAKLKAMDLERIPDYGFYRKLIDNDAENFGWCSLDEELALHRTFHPEMDELDEWKLYQRWMKLYMRK